MRTDTSGSPKLSLSQAGTPSRVSGSVPCHPFRLRLRTGPSATPSEGATGFRTCSPREGFATKSLRTLANGLLSRTSLVGAGGRLKPHGHKQILRLPRDKELSGSSRSALSPSPRQAMTQELQKLKSVLAAG